jgi:hypothetical protein
MLYRGAFSCLKARVGAQGIDEYEQVDVYVERWQNAHV